MPVRRSISSGGTILDRLTFVIVSDEEIGERHSVELLKELGPQHDAVLTLEAARENGDIVTARKAGCWVTVEVTGKAAHAGVEPEKGTQRDGCPRSHSGRDLQAERHETGDDGQSGRDQRRTRPEYRRRHRRGRFRPPGLVKRRSR